MKRIAVLEKRWYLHYQDGKVNDEGYPTQEAAKAAFKQMPRFERLGISIQEGPWIEVELS